MKRNILSGVGILLGAVILSGLFFAALAMALDIIRPSSLFTVWGILCLVFLFGSTALAGVLWFFHFEIKPRCGLSGNASGRKEG